MKATGAAQMEISVVIPTFNRGHVLGRALESVRAQTRPAAEVIVVDDGSTDGTEALVRERFPEVLYLRRSNRGVSAARNAGIEAARGDWVAFLDSDDAWLPSKLERQCEAVGRTREAGLDRPLCHTDEVWIRRGRRVNSMKKHAKAGGDIFTRCLPLCAVSPSSALIERRVFDEIGAFDESLPACEDYDLWLRVTARWEVEFVAEPLVLKYGGHPDQLSRQYVAMDRFRIAALEKLLTDTTLTPDRERAALETLLNKIDIYASGAGKRGKHAEARAYRERAAAWRARLVRLLDKRDQDLARAVR